MIADELMKIPGIGKSISKDLHNIHIHTIEDLKGKTPDNLFEESNKFAGVLQDRCLLYVFRCAVYYAENEKHELEKLKWWNWKDL